MLADDSKKSPYNTDAEPCGKCQHTSCFSLHYYTSANCPFKTCNMCLDLEKLDAQISNVHSLLIDLSKKRCELKGKINHLHDRLIHHLPIEVISYIFVFFVESNKRHSRKSTGLYPWSPSLILGAVCRRWRDITLGISQLWTEVMIDPWKRAFSLGVTREWLCRSRALPLSLTIKSTSKLSIKASFKPPTLLLKHIFQLLRTYSSRWRSLTLDVPSHIVDCLLNSLESDSHVDFLHTDTADRTGTEMNAIAMQNPLIPTDLHARNISLLKNPLQWDRLTHLDICEVGVEKLLHILSHATYLQTCITESIDTETGGYAMTPSTMSIVHNSLKSLDTLVCYPEANVLQQLTLPALENLRYRYPYPQDEGMNILADFLDRSEPFLHNFSFVYYVEDHQGLIDEDWYDKLPSITHLELNISDSGDFLQTMDELLVVLDPYREPLSLPCLQELRIVISWMPRAGWVFLGNLFAENDEERSVANTAEGLPKRPLKSVYIHLRTCQRELKALMDENSYYRLLEIRESGIRITVVNDRGTDLLAFTGHYGIDYGNEEASEDDVLGDDSTEEDSDDDGTEDSEEDGEELGDGEEEEDDIEEDGVEDGEEEDGEEDGEEDSEEEDSEEDVAAEHES